MAINYAGPEGTNDFDGLTVDAAAHKLRLYQLLGACFEDSDAEDMFGRGWLLEEPLTLLSSAAQRAAQAERELHAAVELARLQGIPTYRIAQFLNISE